MTAIGIVTLWGNTNYGNRLQNLAAERLVMRQGLSPYTLVCSSNSIGRLQRVKVKVSELLRTPQMIARRKAFDLFNQDYLHPLDISQNSECAAFICGSDQIWNYTFPEFGPDMFLAFANNKPTCALAASFGVNSVPDELSSFYAPLIERIDFISVREDAGAKLVRQLSGRSAEVLVDPTMALTKAEWEALAVREVQTRKPYAFTYFLGKRPDGLEGRIKRELEIGYTVSFNDVKRPEFFAADPLEFVASIAQSSVVVTDSFHGAVFSIIFEKPFIVYKRDTAEKSMSSRLTTLLGKFGMDKNNIEKLSSLNECVRPGIETRRKLEIERSKVDSFLSSALRGIGR